MLIYKADAYVLEAFYLLTPSMGAPTETAHKLSVPSDDAEPKNDEYTTLELGVWRVLLPSDAAAGGLFSATVSKWNAIAFAYPVVYRFFREIYSLSPHLVIMVILLKLWGELESVLMLYVSGRLLQIIEVGLTEGRPDVNAITQALVARLIGVTVTATARWGRWNPFLN
ncbi:hypothetical protein B0H16DRAFT_590413 [Mycena metata]|uniref:Uncharacterized protein n=1 Tax=Mycena metata TaxID=1033252 RepID=A0AAD7H4N1_9AGAR|nr:hypothetical protein B0H16DRAFT_590413 [Mycena metata]